MLLPTNCPMHRAICRFNPLTPNDDYSGRTAPLTSKRCILYIYSTNIGTEYFKHDIYCPFFPLQNAVCFINLTYLVPVLFTFYIPGVLKLKKNNSSAKRLTDTTARWMGSWDGSRGGLGGLGLLHLRTYNKNHSHSMSRNYSDQGMHFITILIFKRIKCNFKHPNTGCFQHL